MDYDKLALDLHEKYGGKLTSALRDKGQLDETKLSAYYTPGIGAVSQAIADDATKLKTYTWVNNLVAVISDGSSVLGLGDIGPRAAMPVMEGKSLLFKHFADIDSMPITLDVHSVDEIVATITAIAPSFGAINLEDIAAPQCFEIEERLKNELDIPVFHDDQHGTAIVVLAGLLNAMKVVEKDIHVAKIVIIGAGAAGMAITKLLHLYGVASIIAVDSTGIIGDHRTNLNQEKKQLFDYIDTTKRGSLKDALSGADVFIGVSRGGLLHADAIRHMNERPVVFALANPEPEILPSDAKAAGASVIATGRSDFPNQINNAVVFPGIFRGALDNNVSAITDNHKLAAAEVIASLVPTPTADRIIPSVFHPRLVQSIAEVIK